MIAAITLILRQGAFGAPSATGLLDIAIKVGVDLRGPAGDHCREDDRLAAGLARCHLPSGLVRCHDCDQLLEVEGAKSNSVFYYRQPTTEDPENASTAVSTSSGVLFQIQSVSFCFEPM